MRKIALTFATTTCLLALVVSGIALKQATTKYEIERPTEEERTEYIYNYVKSLCVDVLGYKTFNISVNKQDETEEKITYITDVLHDTIWSSYVILPQFKQFTTIYYVDTCQYLTY